MARFSVTGIVGGRRALAGWRSVGAFIAVVLAVVIAICAQTASGSTSHVARVAEVAAPVTDSTASVASLISPERVLAQGLSGAPSIYGCPKSEAYGCYDVNQLHRAYGLLPLLKKGINGRGTTIVIVDAFGSPTIASDLKTFDKGMGLRNPPSLKVIRPVERLPKWLLHCGEPANMISARCGDYGGWQIETSMDVEWAHAMAPGAKIVLVETTVDETEGPYGFKQIVAAENYVINHHIGQVITQSFGANEQTFTSKSQIYRLRSAYVNAARHGVTVLAGSGDTGATDAYCHPASGCANSNNVSCCMSHRAIMWPASDPLVTAVGGTKLTLNASGKRTAPDTVWNDLASMWYGGKPAYTVSLGASGGGLSSVFKRPAFQNRVAKVVGDRRGTPDISMSASGLAGVSVYVAGAWSFAGGTSLASPLFAGIVALADQAAGRSVGYLNPYLYELGQHPRANGIVAITRGTNSFTFCKAADFNAVGRCRSKSDMVTVRGYAANGAYNDATGLGTIDASKFVPALAKLVKSR